MRAFAQRALKRRAEAPAQLGGEKYADDLSSSIVLPEPEFIDILCLERRRSERSNRPFILMLLEGAGLFGKDRCAGVQVTAALLSCTRDTDVLGWYRNGAIMAILFTEISGPPAEAVTLLYTKIASALRHWLAMEQAAQIEINVYLFPEPSNGDSSGLGDLTLYPDIKRRMEEEATTHRARRALDIAGSVVALLAFSPLMLPIALAIKLTSRGPVLFRQHRVGQHGQTFKFLKFRSMYENNDDRQHKEYVAKLIAGTGNVAQVDTNGKSVFKITNDPRITPIGHILRRFSLDELPQFMNVLKGEMSLVGPRPSLPYEVAKYHLWHRRRLLFVKPGITGLWQVSGRCRIGFNDMVRLDLQYIQEASVKRDLDILLQTPLAVLSGGGAH